MIQSMTAFARESAPLNEGVLTVELRTVNHRYLDCTFKLPDALRVMEPQLRDEAARVLARGKLECLVRLQAHQSNTAAYRIDDQRLAELLQAVDALQKQLREPAPSMPFRSFSSPAFMRRLKKQMRPCSRPRQPCLARL